MKSMKTWRLVWAILAVLFIASCSSDPEWADPEAHEKTEQLRQQYGPILVGTWHIEKIGEKQRYFERLTFNADGTLTGMRKWQSRELVSIDGEKRYTDWENVDDENGTFAGEWKLSWNRNTENHTGSNTLILWAGYEEPREWTTATAYSLNARFVDADESKLSIVGGYVRNGDNGQTVFTRGDGKPSF